MLFFFVCLFSSLLDFLSLFSFILISVFISFYVSSRYTKFYYAWLLSFLRFYVFFCIYCFYCIYYCYCFFCIYCFYCFVYIVYVYETRSNVQKSPRECRKPQGILQRNMLLNYNHLLEHFNLDLDNDKTNKNTPESNLTIPAEEQRSKAESRNQEMM